MKLLILFFISLIYGSIGYKSATKYHSVLAASNEKVLSKNIKKRDNENYYWDKEKIETLIEKHMMASEDARFVRNIIYFDLAKTYKHTSHRFFVAVSKGNGNASDQIELRGDFIKHEANGMLAGVLCSQLASSYQNCNLEQISNFTTTDSIANYILQACPQVIGIAVLGSNNNESGFEWSTLYGGYDEGFDSIQSGKNEVWYTRIPIVDTSPEISVISSSEKDDCSELLPQKNIYGNDLTNEKGQPQHCCGYCKKYSECAAFVWTDNDGGTCWLKKTDGPLLTDSSYIITGIRNKS